MLRSLFVLMMFGVPAAAHAQPQPEPLVQQVKKSIAKGVDNLVRQQAKDGSWGNTLAQEDKTQTTFTGGSTGLAVLALLNCDGIIDDPDIEKRRRDAITAGLANLRQMKAPDTVYVRALQTMAFAEAKTDLATIKQNVQWLIDARVFKDGKFVGWDYNARPNASATDASNSQYAMLALWYARQAGVEIPREVWQSIHDYYRRTQNDDGSWSYSSYYNRADLLRPSESMTVAGLCGMLIASAELNAGREVPQKNGKFAGCGLYGDETALAKAFQRVTSKFVIDLPDKTYYHLYGIERAGRLSGFRFFGEHDWYREGCELLVKRQDPDGSWGKRSQFDRWPHVNTSFALLFLSKGRTPVLISKLVHGTYPRREDNTDWNNDRNDLRHLTEYFARDESLFGKKPLAWQTYDIMRALYTRTDKPTKDDETAIVADMKQSPILYITGHNAPMIQDAETPIIKRYIENGGFVFAEACCGNPDFDAGFKKWVKDTWDADLVYIEATHPVWTCHHTLSAGDPFKLMALQIGCRTVMLYSPQDMSCHWESNKHKDGVPARAFMLGANIAAYATGRTAPLPRLTPIAIAGAGPKLKDPTKPGYFRVGQIYHQGEWQAAPKAMPNLMEHVHKTLGLDVLVKPERILQIDDPSVNRFKFFYLHGRNDFHLKGDLARLRFNLENGGLLLADACCGSEVFDKAFRKFAGELFPKEKLERIPLDDRLFSAGLNNVPLTAANIKCRTKANGKLEAMAPYLEGVKIDGRWVVVYSKYDIGCALERSTSAYCVGYDENSALRIATAAVRYNVRP